MVQNLILQSLARLPIRALHGLAWLLGTLFYLSRGRKRSVTEVNLRLCFPELSVGERARLARRSLVESSKTLFELPKLWLGPVSTTLGLVIRVSGRHLVDEALAEGRGVLLMSPHLGNWELAGLYCSHHYPMTIMYRTQRDETVNRFMRRGRTRFGGHLVPATRHGLKELLKTLSGRGVIGILPDQNPGAGTGVFVPFFGVTTYTPTFAAKLVVRTRAKALLVFAERLPRGQGFHLHFSPASDCLGDSDVSVGAACMNRDLEQVIRSRAEQYWWSYNRFRTRPPGEPPVY
jgi:KDO2-lipid IV(A) lauroyltransferase